MFQSAVGWDHLEQVPKHVSQKDYKTGFGGKFGVQTDRVDKSAVGWEHIEKVEKHESQKGNLFVLNLSLKYRLRGLFPIQYAANIDFKLD